MEKYFRADANSIMPSRTRLALLQIPVISCLSVKLSIVPAPISTCTRQATFLAVVQPPVLAFLSTLNLR